MRKKRPSQSRFASRYLLPVEIFMAATLFGWGWSGWVGYGALSGVLDSALIASSWGVSLCLIGAAQAAFALAEGCFGRRWDDHALLWSVSFRCICALFAAGAWMYILFVAIVVPTLTFVTAMVVQAPVGIMFSLIIFGGNLKIRCALDPEIPTENLQRRILADRKGAL